MGLESIGKNIRKFRVANHLRLEDLAEKVVQIGDSFQRVPVVLC